MPVVGYCRNFHANLCPCFVCCKKFSLDYGVEDLLTHICFTHRVVIEHIDRIADFQKYMEYYANRFKEAPLESFTKEFIVEVPEKDTEPREQKYYLLGDFIPEDEALRKNLHAKRLKAAQKQQKKDLSPRYNVRHCFYCHQTLEVTNIQWVNHFRGHGFQLGHPEKLVYIEKFLEAIEDTFRRLRCLYCDNEFESCRALIAHMEEKGHQKIHPNDRFYDQFYMINYIEFGKTWLDFMKDKNKSNGEQEDIRIDDDLEWSSWGSEPENIMCLFCKHMCKSWDGVLLHLQVSHNFDFRAETSHLSFYQQVKVVNFIRRRILNYQCVMCDYQGEDVIAHMEKNNHLVIPDEKLWNHPEYFFCSLENDMFLCHLEDEEGTDKEIFANGSLEEVDVCVSENSKQKNSESERQESMLKDESVSLSEENNKDHITASGIEELNKTIVDVKIEEPVPICESEKISKELIVEINEKREFCPSAHVGAGDSAHNISCSEEPIPMKQMNEFGDA